MSGPDAAYGQHDKRVETRVLCEIPIAWHIQDQVFRDRIRNISAGGVYIETRETMDVGARVIISVPIGSMRTEVQFQGKVLRVTEEGIAVGFEELTTTQENMIRSFLKQISERDCEPG